MIKRKRFDLSRNITDAVISTADICKRVDLLYFLMDREPDNPESSLWYSEHLRLKSLLCKISGHGPFEWDGRFYPEQLTAVPCPVQNNGVKTGLLGVTIYSLSTEPRPYYFSFTSDSGAAAARAIGEVKYIIEDVKCNIHDETWSMLSDSIDTDDYGDKQISEYYQYYRDEYLDSEDGQKDLATLRNAERRLALLEGRI